MNQLRQQNGTFKSDKWLKRITFTIFIALITFIAFHAAYMRWVNTELSATNTMSLVAPVAFAGETPEGKALENIDGLKKKVIDEMVACENPSHLLVWPDDNQAGTLPRKDKVSIGDMAFKLSTVQRFYKILNGKELTDREAMTLALDAPQARQLALDAWISIKGSINEWSCATQEMKTQIEDIRFLTT